MFTPPGIGGSVRMSAGFGVNSASNGSSGSTLPGFCGSSGGVMGVGSTCEPKGFCCCGSRSTGWPNGFRWGTLFCGSGRVGCVGTGVGFGCVRSPKGFVGSCCCGELSSGISLKRLPGFTGSGVSVLSPNMLWPSCCAPNISRTVLAGWTLTVFDVWASFNSRLTLSDIGWIWGLCRLGS